MLNKIGLLPKKPQQRQNWLHMRWGVADCDICFWKHDTCMKPDCGAAMPSCSECLIGQALESGSRAGQSAVDAALVRSGGFAKEGAQSIQVIYTLSCVCVCVSIYIVTVIMYILIY